MGYFIGIAFWILLSGCLLTKSNPIAHGEVHALKMLEAVTCPQDSTFYAPKSENETCISPELECVYKELNGTAKAECGNEDIINDVLEILEERLKKRALPVLTDSNYCACERGPLMSLKEFVERVKNLFQFENNSKSK